MKHYYLANSKKDNNWAIKNEQRNKQIVTRKKSKLSINVLKIALLHKQCGEIKTMSYTISHKAMQNLND